MASSKETASGFAPYKNKKNKLTEKQKMAIWQELY
jgi:hypothetical protein